MGSCLFPNISHGKGGPLSKFGSGDIKMVLVTYSITKPKKMSKGWTRSNGRKETLMRALLLFTM